MTLYKQRVVLKTSPMLQRLLSSPNFQLVKRSNLWTRPWIGWIFTYFFALLAFFIYRVTYLQDLILVYTTLKDLSFPVVTKALTLGILEDFVCVTYFACAIWLFDKSKRAIRKWSLVRDFWTHTALVQRCHLTPQMVDKITTFSVSWLLYVAMMAPFVADLIVVRTKGMRFTFELVAMAIEERKYLNASPISSEEINEGYKGAAGLACLASFFAFVRLRGSWTNLTCWNPAQELPGLVFTRICTKQVQTKWETTKSFTKVADRKLVMDSTYVKIELCDNDIYASEIGDTEYVASDSHTNEALLSSSKMDYKDTNLFYQRTGIQGIITLATLGILPAIVVALSCASSPLVAYLALNTTLNELFSHALEPTIDVMSSQIQSNVPWVETFIHNATELHTLFGPNTLYRKTTGFQGNLAFDVKVSAENPPNVLLLVIESFRFHDSHYLVGDEDPSNFFKDTNITATPNFDKWAKRGVALRNFWSSIRTSRAIESLLFAQIPYDSAVNTGTSGGKRDVKLAGLPQLFTAKGYETYFTTGSTTDYDNWDSFLPTHGFDHVWNNRKFVKLAESDLGITHDEWFGPEGRGHEWGVHDDISFQLLGDLLINKTKEQNERVIQRKDKKPLFLTHFTISSHGPFTERPRWYAESVKPDFSALYSGEMNEERHKNYLEMRYFTDLELGKFMDRMAEEGILNDTIVVIAGDHGGSTKGEELSGLRVAGAIIAEGRLGDAVGLVLEDAAEHYDILNTLADITGVPEGGFVQNGVGRSLKRNVTFGERVVFSNDPNRKMSVVRGHKHFRYDRVSDSVSLYDAFTDHATSTDLFPELTEDEQAEWLTWRDYGRRINSYYTKRWDKQCLLAADC